MLKIIWERWKKVPELEEIKVSSLGSVKINGKLIRPKVSNTGYFVIEHNDKMYFVHRLVAKAFLKHNLEKYETIDHIDSNRRNNALSNLEIVSAEDNQARAMENLYKHTFEVSALPVWKIRLADGKHEFTTLQKACNSLMNETNLTREEAVKDILGTIIFGLKGTRKWKIVKENTNGKNN